jgi:hypothetical protein
MWSVRIAWGVVLTLLGLGLTLAFYALPPQEHPGLRLLAGIGAVLALLAALVVLVWPRLRGLRRGPDLRVTIERADWEAWSHTAWIVALRVRVQNQSDRRKRIAGTALRSAGGGQAWGTGPAAESERTEAWREAERRKSELPRLDQMSVIEPGTTVTGWVVHLLPLSPEPPDLDFSVEDEMRIEYPAQRKDRLPVRPPRSIQAES